MPEQHGHLAIDAKILSTCRGRRHIVSPRAQLVYFYRPRLFDRKKSALYYSSVNTLRIRSLDGSVACHPSRFVVVFAISSLNRWPWLGH